MYILNYFPTLLKGTNFISFIVSEKTYLLSSVLLAISLLSGFVVSVLSN